MSQGFGRIAAMKAAILVTGSTYVAYAVGLVVSALVARALGPADFGRYAYVVWLSGWLVYVANNGLTTSAIQFISESIGRGSLDTARNVQGWLLRRQALTVLVVVVLFAIAGFTLRPEAWQPDLTVFIAVVAISMAAKAFYLFQISVGKGYGRFGVEAYSMIVVTIFNCVAVIVLNHRGAGLTAYLWLFAITSVAYIVYALLMLRHFGIAAVHGALPNELLPRLRRHLMWTILLSTVGMIGNKSIETFLLGKYAAQAAVGFFAIASALTRGGVDLLTGGLMTVMMPAMAHAYGEGGNVRVNAILCNAVRFFLFFGLLLAGVGALWSRPIVSLMYGDQFLEVVPVLRAMVVVGGLTLSEGAFGAMLSTTNNQRGRFTLSATALFLSAAAAIALVPRYGLTGAIVAHASSRLLIFLVFGALIVRQQAIRLPYGSLLRVLLASVVALTVAWPLAWRMSSLVGDMAAGIVYAVVLIVATALLKVWHKNDLGMALTVADRYPAITGWARPLLLAWQSRFAV